MGPDSEARRAQSPIGRAEFLDDGVANLARVLANVPDRVRRQVATSMGEAYDGLQSVSSRLINGLVHVFVEESGGREIPASRLSDGTMRYLALLLMLLHPEPPPLVAIEEPELGLHADLMPGVARLLRAASERTQLVVTTHSRTLVDALSDSAESVVVCEKRRGCTSFQRLDPQKLSGLLDQESLGKLWSAGDIGGNRW